MKISCWEQIQEPKFKIAPVNLSRYLWLLVETQHQFNKQSGKKFSEIISSTVQKNNWFKYNGRWIFIKNGSKTTHSSNKMVYVESIRIC